MKWVKRILIGLLVLVVVAIAATFLVPLDSYRGSIEATATHATGREVKIAGPMHLTIYPELGVSIGDVTMANAPGAHDPQMISVGDLIVGVKVLPLLSGNVEVARLILDKPVIHLEIAANGTPNFGFAAPGATPEAAQPTSPEAGAQGMPNNIGIGDLRINNGEVTYFDARSGKRAALEDVDVALQMPAADQPLTLDGALTYQKQRLNAKVQLDNPAAIMNGNSKANFALTSDLLNASFDGTLAAHGTSQGALKLDTRSLRDLAAWAGHPLPPGKALGATQISANVTRTGGRVTLDALKLAMDGMNVTGNLAVNTAAKPLALTGTLAVDRLNLNNFLTTGGGQAAQKPATQTAAGGGAAPLDLSLLKVADANLNLSADTLQIQKITMNKAALGVTLKGGQFTANLKQIALYKGSGTGTLSIDSRPKVPTFHTALHVANVQVLPFMTDLIQVTRMDGTGAFDFDVTTHGATQQAIMSGLNGKANLKFTNGQIKGVDLAAVARVLQTLVSGGLAQATSDTASTQFTSLGGTFTIRNGVAHNTDFKLLNPVVQITGNGDIDLGRRTLDFHLTPRPAATGKVGGVDLASVGVPFEVSGPWTKLHYGPDVKGITSGVVNQLLKGGKSGQTPANPTDALKSLFGIGK